MRDLLRGTQERKKTEYSLVQKILCHHFLMKINALFFNELETKKAASSGSSLW